MTCDQQIFDDAFHKAMISNPTIQDMRSHMVTIETRAGGLKSDLSVIKADFVIIKADLAIIKKRQCEMNLKLDEMNINIRIIRDTLIPPLKVAPPASTRLT